MKLVLGIDPGTRVAGWGVVSDREGALALVGAGVVRAPAERPASERLKVRATSSSICDHAAAEIGASSRWRLFIPGCSFEGSDGERAVRAGRGGWLGLCF